MKIESNIVGGLMKYWLVHHSWESFKATKEYCGFKSEEERNKITVGDKVVYFGQSLVFGVFDVIALPTCRLTEFMA